MKWQTFDVAWKKEKPQLIEKPVEKPAEKLIEKPVEKVVEKVEKVDRLEKPLAFILAIQNMKNKDLIIVGLGFACFFLFMWSVSATMASNRIARLHSQLLEKLILNLSK